MGCRALGANAMKHFPQRSHVWGVQWKNYYGDEPDDWVWCWLFRRIYFLGSQTQTIVGHPTREAARRQAKQYRQDWPTDTRVRKIPLPKD